MMLFRMLFMFNYISCCITWEKMGKKKNITQRVCPMSIARPSSWSCWIFGPIFGIVSPFFDHKIKPQCFGINTCCSSGVILVSADLELGEIIISHWIIDLKTTMKAFDLGVFDHKLLLFSFTCFPAKTFSALFFHCFKLLIKVDKQQIYRHHFVNQYFYFILVVLNSWKSIVIIEEFSVEIADWNRLSLVLKIVKNPEPIFHCNDDVT